MANNFKSFEALQQHLLENGQIELPEVTVPANSDVKSNAKEKKKHKKSKSKKSGNHITKKQMENRQEAIGEAVKAGRVNVIFNHETKPLPTDRKSEPFSDEKYWKIDAAIKHKSQEATYRAPEKNKNELEKIRHVDLLSIGGPHKCIRDKHNMESLRAIVNVINKVGDVKAISFNATYCFNCNKYFMEDWQYELLMERGIPKCRVDYEKHSKHYVEISGYGKLHAESLIHQYGYNVQEKMGLTDIQRQTLLMYLIENNIVKSKMEITTHLTWLINQKQGNPIMANAISKWKADRQFVEQYKLGTYKVVVVRSIKK